MITKRKLLAVIFYTLILLSAAQPVSAQTSEDSGKRQSPSQVITTIVLCAITMRILASFKIP